MITKPPPKASAPILSAVQASAPTPPAWTAPAQRRRGRASPASRGSPSRRRRSASSTSTSHGPISTAASAAGEDVDAPAGETRALRSRTRAKLGPIRPRAACAGDGGDRGAGAGARAAHPVWRRVGEEEDAQREDQHDRGDDESETADDRARRPAGAVGAEDRHLRRGRPGEQAARGVGVLEGARVEPAAALDHQAAQQRDVRGRAAEAGQADPRPLAGDRPQRRPRLRRGREERASGAVIRAGDPIPAVLRVL